MSEPGDQMAGRVEPAPLPPDEVSDGALGEVDRALAAYADPARLLGEDDVETICDLALHRVDLVGTRVPVPAEVVEGWARLGDWDEVERLVQQAAPGMELVERLLAAVRAPGAPSRLADLVGRLGSATVRVPLLLALAEAVADDDPDASRTILRQAVELAEAVDAAGSADALTGLVAALWARGLDDPEARAAAERLERQIDDPVAQAQTLAAAASAIRDREPAAAREALESGEKAAAAVGDPARRAQAAMAVAAASMFQDEAAGRRLLHEVEDGLPQVEDPGLQAQLRAGLVGVWARLPGLGEDPGAVAAVEHLADEVEVPGLRDRALCDLAIGLAESAASAPSETTETTATVLARAAEIAARVRTEALAGEAGVALAAAWATASSSRSGLDGIAEATAVAEAVDAPEWRSRAFVAIAAAEGTPDAAAAVLTRAHEAADAINDPAARSRAWARLAVAHQGRDDEAARRLLDRAEHVVGHVPSPLIVGHLAEQVTVALALQASTHPEAVTGAERIAERIVDPGPRDRARAAVVSGLLAVADDHSAPERAREVAGRIEDPEAAAEAQAALAVADAQADGGRVAAADRAAQLVDEIRDPGRRGRALHEIASNLVVQATALMTASGYHPVLPDLAIPPGLRGMPGIDGLADLPGFPGSSSVPQPGDEPGGDGDGDSEVAALLAKAEELAGRIPDPSQRCTALAGFGATLATFDPGQAERFFDLAVVAAESIRTPHLACHALAGVAGALGVSRAERARGLLAAAETRLGEVEGVVDREQAAAAIALALVVYAGGDLDTMAQLRRLLDHVQHVPTRCQLLAQLSSAWAPIDDRRSQTLLRRAEYEATQPAEQETRDLAVTMLAAGLLAYLVVGDQDRVAVVERLLPDVGPATRIRILLLLSTGAGAGDPSGQDPYLARAEEEAGHIADPALRGEVLAAVAAAHVQRAMTAVALPPMEMPPGSEPMVVGPVFPDRAWRLLAGAAVDPGFGNVDLLTALVRVGGPSAVQAVTDHAVAVLCERP